MKTSFNLKAALAVGIIASSSSLVGQTITGSGTSGNVPKFTGASTIGNSQLYDNGSSVIMGGTSPIGGENFSIQKNYSGATFMRIYNNSTGNAASVNYIATAGSSGIAMAAYGPNFISSGIYQQNSSVLNGSGTNMNIGTNGATPLNFWTNNYKRMTILQGTNANDGYIGILNPSPQYQLDVNGTINTNGFLQSKYSASNLLTLKADGANAVIDGYPALLLNYYSGKDIYMCTGTDGGVVSVGKNLEIGSPTRDLNASLNIKTNGTTTGIKVQDASGNSILSVLANGKVHIGTKNPVSGQHDASLLSVYGDITTTAIYVTDGTLASKWADFVFDKNYKLLSLEELEKYYTINHHLPNMPTTADVKENGLDVASTEALLLQKIEELTLYVVDQQKQIEKLRKQIENSKN